MKQPNWKTPFLLSTLLFLLGGGAYWLEYSYRPKQKQKEETVKNPLSLSDTEQVRSITVQGKKTKIALELREKNWFLTEPLAFPADHGKMQPLLVSIKNLSHAEVLDLSQETPEQRNVLLQSYQLGAQQLTSANTPTLEIELTSGERYQLWLGDAHPFANTVYALAGKNKTPHTEKVYMVPQHFADELEPSLNAYKNKTIFTFNKEAITSIQGKNKWGKFSLTQGTSGWTLNGAAVDPQRLDRFPNLFINLQAQDFIDSLPKSAKKILSFEILAQGKKNQLNLFDHDELTVSGRKEIFKISKTVQGQWNVKPSELLPAPKEEPKVKPKK